MEPSYVEVNRVQYDRLVHVLARLTDADLARRLPNGLSVADVLVHLAFWDRYARDVLVMWQRDGFSGSRTHYEAVNAAVLMLASAVSPHDASRFALDSAESVDREAAQVPAALAKEIIDGDKLRTLERGQHRREHLDQLEGLLATPQEL